MKALVLAAGYATRLRPLTERIAKPLLPVGGRPMIDIICDKIAEVPEVDGVHVVTNHRFAAGFEAWATKRGGVTVHDDGTSTNEDRLGAIGDISFTIEHARLTGDDLLVIAGDNLFDFSLAEYVSFFRGKKDGSTIALYECDRELVKEYSVVEVDAHDRVLSFVEKPSDPRSNLAGIATYLFHRDHVPLFQTYLAEGRSPDQPGNFIAWLYPRVPVYGYRFRGEWLDIGNHEQLLHADNMLRQRRGLAARETYSVDS